MNECEPTPSMNSFSPLWSFITKSSLWREADYVIKIFLTMLALKDADHIYRGTAFNLSEDSKKSETEVLDALKILSSPDKIRKERQEFQGRRIKLVPEGWLILNGEKYRDMMKVEMERRRWKKAQKARRERLKAAKASNAPTLGERLVDQGKQEP